MAARNRGRGKAGSAGKSRVVPAQRRGERANAAAATNAADEPAYTGKSIQQQVADRRAALQGQLAAGAGADAALAAASGEGRRPSARRAAVTRRSETAAVPATPKISDAKVAARREQLAKAVHARCERARTGDAAEKIARLRELVHLRSFAYDAEFHALLSDLEREHDVERDAQDVADAIAPEIELASLPADAE